MRTKQQALQIAVKIQTAVFKFPTKKQRKNYISKYFKDINFKEIHGSKVGKIQDFPRKKYYSVSLTFGHGSYNYAENAIIDYE